MDCFIDFLILQVLYLSDLLDVGSDVIHLMLSLVELHFLRGATIGLPVLRAPPARVPGVDGLVAGLLHTLDR